MAGPPPLSGSRHSTHWLLRQRRFDLAAKPHHRTGWQLVIDFHRQFCPNALLFESEIICHEFPRRPTPPFFSVWGGMVVRNYFHFVTPYPPHPNPLPQWGRG